MPRSTRKQDYLGWPCHDCGAKEAQLHRLGCDMERCPVCGAQAITCYEHCVEPVSGDLRQEFIEGHRIPFIVTPTHCARCLEPYPEPFTVPDEEWQRLVPPDLRDEILCRACYVRIGLWMEASRARPR